VVPFIEPTAVDRHRVRLRYKLPQQFLLYFGTLEPRKNVASIIRAFVAIADQIPHHLVIAGSKGWLTSLVSKVLAHSKHRERIHTIGLVQESDKATLYAMADLFVYPSFYEGFGFPPLEALQAGTPVLTSYNSSLPEIVGDYATLINPYDTGELALLMHELLRHPIRVSADIQKIITEHYSWQEAARQTVRVLEQI
jgi:glycosyltransferase involved in cell wall biosynthesis